MIRYYIFLYDVYFLIMFCIKLILNNIRLLNNTEKTKNNNKLQKKNTFNVYAFIISVTLRKRLIF